MKLLLLFLTCLPLLSCDDHFDRGQVALGVQDFTRAQIFFSNHLDLQPDHFEARQGYILSLVGLIEQVDSIPSRDWNEVERQISICSRSQGSPCLPTIQFKLNYQLAKYNYRRMRDDQALHRIDKALTIIELDTVDSQKVVFGRHLKASILVELGQHNEAIKLLQHNLQQTSVHKGSYALLGSILVEQAEFIEAILILEQGQLNFPNDNSLSYWLNEAYEGSALLESEWD